MKGKKYLIIAIAGLGSLVLGCNSDNSIDCPEDFTGALAANEQKLTGEWKLTAITSDKAVDLTDDNETNPSQNIYIQYTDCQKDGVYQFDADRNYTFNQGTNVSNCANKSSSDGTWQLNAEVLSLVGACNQQFVGIDFNGDASAFSFSEDFNVTDVRGSSIPAKITFTYTKAL
ncbi:hypothetical protein LCGC14_1215700 [marine sediment metagenome]|uniref:DUF5004 domain-containing protein n=2 Tax=root TaxID=1 RepID=A0A831QNN5_9FLAO|nr:DUF5004 domain-containing protein [Pricia sp.]HEA19986.1 DUF5004 domain-containing protein [Pricia antarctica]